MILQISEVLCASRAEVLLPVLSPSCAASNNLSCASSRYLLLKTHQLSLDAFLVALKFMQVEGVDIAEVKRLYGNKVALCGNVHCAAMQTGTEAEVIASAEYCLTHAKPGGGYVFATSNIPFKGLPLERYLMVLGVWKRMRDY